MFADAQPVFFGEVEQLHVLTDPLQIYFIGKNLFATDFFDGGCQKDGNIFRHDCSDMEQQTKRLVHFDDLLENGIEMLVMKSSDQLADFLKRQLLVLQGGQQCRFQFLSAFFEESVQLLPAQFDFELFAFQGNSVQGLLHLILYKCMPPNLQQRRRSVQQKQRASENIRFSCAFIAYPTRTYNHQMTINLKVQFQDKLYKLTQHTTALSQVHQEMKQRFPNLPPLHYYYQDAEVTDLHTLLASAARQGLSSIKLIARKDSTDVSRLNEVSKVADSERNDSSVISLLAEDTSKAQITTRVTLPIQFYVCYNCQGAKKIKQMSRMEVCTVCKGAGRLQQGHKYVKRLKELYLNHFRPAEQAEMLLENLNEETVSTVSQRKSSFEGVDKRYEVIVRETTRKETVQIGKVFSMKFQIKNIGPNWQKKHIEIVEIGQQRGKVLSALKTGQAVQVELGPFVCSVEGSIEKTYVLCYREGDNLIRFGHKFGFIVRGVKAKAVKKLFSNQRERIRDLKMVSGSTKSEQYLSLKLKSMGIDVMNLQMDDQVILDVIRQFK